MGAKACRRQGERLTSGSARLLQQVEGSPRDDRPLYLSRTVVMMLLIMIHR